jgi:hypothetical protein
MVLEISKMVYQPLIYTEPSNLLEMFGSAKPTGALKCTLQIKNLLFLENSQS